jgi:dipeptidyl aminopeptidase/acylaminoacyl peptidase
MQAVYTRWQGDKRMRTLFFSLLAALTIGCATPKALVPAPSRLSNLQPVALPDFDSDRGIKHSSSQDAYDAARADQRFEMRQFTYVSDGLTVGAYLYGARLNGEHPMPVIVFNRGGFTRPDGFAGEMLVMAHRYAEAGFLVVAPQLRGSNGWEGRDELGGADVHDLMNIVPELAKIAGADKSRVYLAGESRGGAMVYMALRAGFPARAAAVWGAFTDVDALIAPGGPQAKFAPMIWPDIEQHRAQIVQSRSALSWPEKIGAPVLIMHGGADGDIPVEQSQKMDAALTKLGKPHDFKVFEGEPHTIGGRSADRDAAAIAWFRKYGAQKGHA